MTKRRAVITLLPLLTLVVTLLASPRIIENKYNRVLNEPPYHASAAATELHNRLFIADLHADSLLWGRNLLARSSTGHVDVPRLQQANVSLQVFTVVTTIPRNLNIEHNTNSSDMIRYLAMAEGWPPGTWNTPRERALYQASRLRKFESDSGGQLTILRTHADLQRFVVSRQPHQVAVLLGAEGAQPLEGKLENLDDLYAAGFRLMAPTHFTDTEIAGSAAGQHKNGLTSLGRKWVRAMEDHSMIIDLAHASPATIRDVTATATRPLIVSHTGVKGTCNNNRNLSDDELHAVARTGGIVGIGYWKTAVCGEDARAVARAIRYAVGVIGVEHVALGSDFDGAVTTPFDVTGLPLITEALQDAGFSERDIGLIMGGNAVRILSQNLP